MHRIFILYNKNLTLKYVNEKITLTNVNKCNVICLQG